MKRLAIVVTGVLALSLLAGSGLEAPGIAAPKEGPAESAVGKAPPSPEPRVSRLEPGFVRAPKETEPAVIITSKHWSGPAGSMRKIGVKAVALTFDDGPDPNWTPRVLTLLRRFDVKATFCVVGTEVETYPAIVKQIAADGHTLCNHSWHHEFDLGRKSAKIIRANLERTNEAILKLVPGADIGYYRQPGGNWTPRIIDIARELDMVPTHWTVDPGDWNKTKSVGHIESNVLTHTKPGSIVLMHDGGGERSRTFEALTPILRNLTARFNLIPLPTRTQRPSFGGNYPN